MQNLLASLAVTLFVGVLAVLAQWSRKSRRAELSPWIAPPVALLLVPRAGALLVAAGGAQWARTGRPAEISLWIVLRFASLLVLGAGALLVAARLSGGVPAEIYP